MLRAAIGFFVLGLLALFFGANGIAGVSIEMGRILLLVFIVLAVLSMVSGMIGGRRGKYLP